MNFKKLMSCFLISIITFPCLSIAPTFSQLEQDWNENKMWALQTTLDLHGCNYELIRNKKFIEEYITNVCDWIGINRSSNPVTIHFDYETNSVYIDIFSNVFYSPYQVAYLTFCHFESEIIDAKIVYRGAVK